MFAVVIKSTDHLNGTRVAFSTNKDDTTTPSKEHAEHVQQQMQRRFAGFYTYEVVEVAE